MKGNFGVTEEKSGPPVPLRPPFRVRHPVLFWTASVAILLTIFVLGVFEVLLFRAEPILRERVVESLATRYKSRVELKSLRVSVLQGFEVIGEGLAIYPYNLETTTPTLSVERFSFHTTYGNLMRTPMVLGRVELNGLSIHLPPKSQRKALPSLSSGTEAGDGKISIFVNEIDARDTMLVLGTDKPGKVPLEWDIQRLVLKSVGAGKPMNFVATLTNPKPVGDIKTTGYFGPWNSDDPRESAVGGEYSFSNADLGTIKGIGGILSSRGRYQGELDQIVVDGETDTPDFRVNVSGHPVPLHTDFHAIVDGTTGDTFLQPVVAHFLHTSLTANGYVVRTQGVPGHHIQLDVVVDQGNIQDLLRLAVRTDPPLMTGGVRMRTKLDLPPGQEEVPMRLKLQGNFEILNAYFSNPKIQSRVDELSLRGQGKPEMAHQESKDPSTATIASNMKGNFNMGSGKLQISDLVYEVPGATINLDGVYGLDGNTFDFHGNARLKATISQIVGGWKGALLTPFDQIFQKHGAGTEVPIKITGTKSEPHFGLDFGHHDSPKK